VFARCGSATLGGDLCCPSTDCLVVIAVDTVVLWVCLYCPVSVWLAGDNLLSVVRGIVDSPLLADPADYRHGHMIYFDFVGLFMVLLPVRLGMLINALLIIFVTLYFASKLLTSRRGK